MTAPIASASTNVYTVVFDGSAVRVLAKRRQKVLRTIPLAELVAVDFKPARGVGGGSLRFRTTGRQSARDVIMFNAHQQPDLERLAATVQRYHRPVPSASDPWAAAHPVTAVPAAGLAWQENPEWKKIGRLASMEAGLQLIIALPALILLLAICGGGIWLLVR